MKIKKRNPRNSKSYNVLSILKKYNSCYHGKLLNSSLIYKKLVSIIQIIVKIHFIYIKNNLEHRMLSQS